MVDARDFTQFLAESAVDDDVFALRPDYRVILLAVDGLVAGPSDELSDAMLSSAEDAAKAMLQDQKPEQLPHVAAWREAYRAFGAKPQRTRNSLEALLRRAETGLPRVNRLTDIYNAISVRHLIPLGGEDLAHYVGPTRLIRAKGTELFDTMSDGSVVTESPEPGEVVWSDEQGVTCRRWNWRQCRRTQLSETTTTAIFILDALAPFTDEELRRTAQELVEDLTKIAPNLYAEQRMIAAP